MHILSVYSHPTREHFPGAVLDAFVEGVVQADHTSEIADLHADGFDPRFTAADHRLRGRRSGVQRPHPNQQTAGERTLTG